ncbi:MAG: prepilin peptidase [Pseudomonadota bacterium]
MSSEVALISLLLLLLPCFYAAWSDLAFMKIPNWLSLYVIAAYLVSMPFLVPLDDMGLRLTIALGVLVLGFVLSVSGFIGAGDAKFGAALMLFVHPTLDHVSFFMQILGMMALAGVLTHRLFYKFAPARKIGAEWQSWQEEKNFPFGLSIAASMLFYLAILLVLT